jgi:polyisoprenoid-binding protein YceI
VRRSPGVTAAVLVLACATGHAAEVPQWRVARGDLRGTCPLTVGGFFEARTASLAGALTPVPARPAAFAGALTVDLRTLETGIGLRDAHMRDQYLEVGKGEGFAAAVLSDLDLGAVPAESLRARVRFTGTLQLHGVRQPVAGQADVRRDGAAVRVEAAFPIALAAYGIAEPRYLGIGVKDTVQVKVTLVATPEPAGAAQ